MLCHIEETWKNVISWLQAILGVRIPAILRTAVSRLWNSGTSPATRFRWAAIPATWPPWSPCTGPPAERAESGVALRHLVDPTETCDKISRPESCLAKKVQTQWKYDVMNKKMPDSVAIYKRKKNNLNGNSAWKGIVNYERKCKTNFGANGVNWKHKKVVQNNKKSCNSCEIIVWNERKNQKLLFSNVIFSVSFLKIVDSSCIEKKKTKYIKNVWKRCRKIYMIFLI